jgi:hypothetical protein
MKTCNKFLPPGSIPLTSICGYETYNKNYRIVFNLCEICYPEGRIVQKASPISESNSFSEKIKTIKSFFSLNQSEFRHIFHMPMDSDEMSLYSKTKIDLIINIISESKLRHPLNRRFVREVNENNCLYSLLSKSIVDRDGVIKSIMAVYEKSERETDRISAREMKLEHLGYSKLTEEESKKNLAANMAQLPWPKTGEK